MAYLIHDSKTVWRLKMSNCGEIRGASGVRLPAAGGYSWNSPGVQPPALMSKCCRAATGSLQTSRSPAVSAELLVTLLGIRNKCPPPSPD